MNRERCLGPDAEEGVPLGPEFEGFRMEEDGVDALLVFADFLAVLGAILGMFYGVYACEYAPR